MSNSRESNPTSPTSRTEEPQPTLLNLINICEFQKSQAHTFDFRNSTSNPNEFMFIPVSLLENDSQNSALSCGTSDQHARAPSQRSHGRAAGYTWMLNHQSH
ncbi:hypothetical protein MJO28_006660 [Puccinia striiformis f. sp. tritici]|uniref:Uncharacterized protein n=1 Tax=Puccinia striiformis f. sp. tritici TaxID=168172 RepID=A0ACC0EI35_9BASI|nr:hypothetical protein MJO28_006660 [Puccinia striiformis f. sp. tritici]